MKQKMKLWVIMNEVGEFSIGGDTPTFWKDGKIWFNEGQLKSHMTRVLRMNAYLYKNAELIELHAKEVKRERIFEMYRKRIMVDRL